MLEGINTSVSSQSVVTGLKTHVCRSDNHLTLIQGVKSFINGITARKMLRDEYDILNSGFEVLMIISYNWLTENKGSTVYMISDGNKDINTSTCYIVKGLLDKGMIEVLGKGNRGKNMYIPTQRVLNDLTVITGELMR